MSISSFISPFQLSYTLLFAVSNVGVLYMSFLAMLVRQKREQIMVVVGNLTFFVIGSGAFFLPGGMIMWFWRADPGERKMLVDHLFSGGASHFWLEVCSTMILPQLFWLRTCRTMPVLSFAISVAIFACYNPVRLLSHVFQFW